jgi:2-amino-4-hydroxy-6-hydroxymethyldihydropteridine diphosphokinase
MADGNCFLVALGANMGGALTHNAQVLREALAMIESAGDVRVLRASRIYRTPAYPPGSGPEFANACAELEAPMEAEAMLSFLHGIEARFGRERTRRWGARSLDLDLLAMGAQVRPDPATLAHWMALPPTAQAQVAPERLILPHPRLHERGFVLQPLAEIAPDWVHPALGQSVAALLAGLSPDALDGIAPIGD